MVGSAPESISSFATAKEQLPATSPNGVFPITRSSRALTRSHQNQSATSSPQDAELLWRSGGSFTKIIKCVRLVTFIQQPPALFDISGPGSIVQSLLLV